jgi:hypothetical protein
MQQTKEISADGNLVNRKAENLNAENVAHEPIICPGTFWYRE